MIIRSIAFVLLTVLASGGIFMSQAGAHGRSHRAAAQAADQETHHGQGVVHSVDRSAGMLNITHEPIESLDWPVMTMDLQVTDKALLDGIEPEMEVTFSLEEDESGEYVINEIAPLTR